MHKSALKFSVLFIFTLNMLTLEAIFDTIIMYKFAIF